MPLRLGRIDTSFLPEILKYALPLALSTMVGTLSINMDLLVIGKMMSTEEFAIYSNMAKELPFNFLIMSFTDVVFPHIIRLKSEKNRVGLIRIYKAYMEFGIVSSWIMIAGAIACAKDIVLVLYSDKYMSGIAIFYIYLLVSALRFTYHGMILSAYGESRKIFKYAIITLIINFFLNIILFYFLGVIGPAMATFIAVLIPAVLQLIESSRLMELPIKSIFNFMYIVKLLVEIILLISITILISNKYFINVPVFIRLVLTYSSFVCILAVLNRRHLLSDLKTLNRG